VSDLLARFPRAALGHWPTPLERAERLSAAVGGDIWIKRDDCSGLALGGNKTRKLEYLLGAARSENCTGAVTFGALQSNHARQTAAACARLGLTCDLILVRAVDRSDEHYLRSGNLLLDGLLGATVHLVDDDDAAFARFAELFGDGARRLYGIGPGGSDPVGTLGYVSAGLELAGQCAAVGLDLGRVVVAASTAGTASGLVLGLAAAGVDAVVDVACVYADATHTAGTIRGLLAGTADLLGVDVPGDDRWTITDATFGPGYGVPTPEGRAAIERLATTEGVLLDPVYTAKAMAHLLATVDDRPTVFVHTGGAPGLFAYTPSFS
jgi:D-cysteine desulfhydrase family pyridoxal phosphate-dependent enzyme